MENIPSTPRVSSDPSTKGFDFSAGQKWIYPMNYPLREYQYNMTKTALFNNTLICLPTGLGKTFIAAVVMFNFWRWYPQGKIVFMAPTKPLVAQQIHACHTIMGIPSTETVEVTGATMNAKLRQDIWHSKRVIFATPQIFHNDLKNNIIDVHSIKCVVIDEAHRASKKHSYCESIRLLSERNTNFRILALSATPGGRIDDVLKVITNLHISSLEIRDDCSPDITPYINQRKIDIISIQLSDKLKEFRDRYISIMDPHVKLLIQRGVIRGYTGDISKGMIFKVFEEFKTRTNKSGDYDFLSKTLTILMTMYHAYDLMIKHGLRAFNHFYQSHSEKYWMRNETQLQSLLEDVDKYLGPFPDIDSILSDDGIPQIPGNIVFGHSKFHKLKEILEEHFRSFESNNKETRAIVFVEYRDLVNEVYVMLLQSHPLLRPRKFMGQAGQRQKEQLRALDDFRNNKVNVLVSTSVGEEGLDVGEVDLIVCFDIVQNNPTRLVQRMGRTGRRRDGHIIILVTEGKEYHTLQQAMRKKDSINKRILESSNITSCFYDDNPRMVPPEYKPECYKMHITVLPKTPDGKGRKKEGIEKKQNEVVKGKKKTSHNKNTKTADDDKIPSKSATSIQGSHSTIMGYFKNTKLPQKKPIDKNQNNILDMFKNASLVKVAKSIKPENVKLLTSDAEMIDFLTMYALRESEIENSECTRNVIDSRYIVSYPEEDAKRLFNGPALDSNILNCLTQLNEKSSCMTPEREEVFENAFEDDGDQNFNPMEFLPEEVENVNDYHPEISKYDDGYISEALADNEGYIEEVSKFEALMDESSSSSINSNNDNNDDKEKSNELLEKSLFEALLSDSSSTFLMNSDNEYEKTMEIESNSIQKQLDDDGKNYEATINMEFGDISKSTKDNGDKNEMTMNVESDDDQDIGLFEHILNDSSEESENQLLPVTENSAFNKSQACVNNVESENSVFKGSIIGDSVSNHDENSNDMFESMDEDFEIEEIPDKNEWIRKATSKTNSICESTNLNDLSNFDESRNDIKLENDTVASRGVVNLNIGNTQKLTVLNNGTSSENLQNNKNLTNSKEVSNTTVDIPECTNENDLSPPISSLKSNLNETKKNSKTLVEIIDLNSSQKTSQSSPQINNKIEVTTTIRMQKETLDLTPEDREELNVSNFNWDDDFIIPQNPITDVKQFQKTTSSLQLSKMSRFRIRLDKLKGNAKPNQLDNVQPTINNPTPRRIVGLNQFFMTPRKKLSNIFQENRAQPSCSWQEPPEQSTNKSDINISSYFKSNNNSGSAKCIPVLNNKLNSTKLQRDSPMRKTQRKEFSLKQHEVNEFCLSPEFENDDNEDTASWKDPSVKQVKTLNDKTVKKRKSHKRRNKDGRVRNKFLDDEAEVSSDGGFTSEGTSDEDGDLSGFVSYTQDVKNPQDMQARYLQSIRSPVKRLGGFCLRKPKSPAANMNIYSQTVEDDSSYLYDSFCVREDDPTEDVSTEYSILDNIEKKFHNNKKRKRKGSSDSRGSTKRIVNRKMEDDTSSEDETEQLRKETLDQSFMMRTKKS